MLPQGHAGPSALRFFLSASCNNPVVLNFLLHLGFSVFFLSPGFTPLFFRTKQDKHSPEYFPPCLMTKTDDICISADSKRIFG